MKLIINHSSMQPIYEQIMEQSKSKVMHGELKEDTALRSLCQPGDAFRGEEEGSRG